MRRPDRVDLLFLMAAIAAAVVILALGAGLTFFSDEWAFIETRSLGDTATWFTPHNEHWATLPILVYRAIVETVGIGSYMPYLAVLAVLHLVVAALVYTLARRVASAWIALPISVVVLFLGSGFENLFWAFQVGFVGATAAGLGALLAFEGDPLSGRRAAVGSTLLLVALATQGGPALAISAVVAVELLLDPRRRRAILFLVFPAAIYAAWYLAIGRKGIDAHQGVFRLGGIADIPPMLYTGFSSIAGSLVGVGSDLGGVVLVVVAVATIVAVVRRGRVAINRRLVACLIGIAFFYGLIALARSANGVSVATLTRYTYVSTILFLVGLAAVFGRPTIATPTARRTWLVAGAIVLTLSLTWNIRLLVAGRALFADRAERTRALVTVAMDRPLPPETDPNRSLVLVPSPNSLERIVTRYGSPLDDSLVTWAVAPIRPDVLADAERVLREGAEIPLPEPPAP